MRNYGENKAGIGKYLASLALVAVTAFGTAGCGDTRIESDRGNHSLQEQVDNAYDCIESNTRLMKELLTVFPD
jgi:hypothetical protein